VAGSPPRWHFSFDHYHDPAQMGVGALRVFNDDHLQHLRPFPRRWPSASLDHLGEVRRALRQL
jgi:hypothetical protein